MLELTGVASYVCAALDVTGAASYVSGCASAVGCVDIVSEWPSPALHAGTAAPAWALVTVTGNR